MQAKKIVNVINFIRAEDPRIAQDVLYDTFKNQVALCKSYPLPYTFLLQYDAMVRPEYAKLLLENDDPNMEIGVWIELAQEQVERVGLRWDGRPGYKWDWHVHPDMLMGYPIPARKLLIDELMNRFHSIFGYYPRSVGSWLLDSYSIAYMAECYHVEAFCICKEQFGTDGYTLWGGYYNQGYYPCKKNMLSPAQTADEQINVPVFRMLGPDPIYQYDVGMDGQYNHSACQHVMTIEPCWECGQSPTWVDWYLHSTFEEEALGLAYTQTGQENPFTWATFGKSLRMQMEKIYAGHTAGIWEVLSLGDTGRWFKSTYATTPATAMTALTDWKKEGRQSVWYNSKRYRANWYAENGHLLLRDLFLFDEQYAERYWDEHVTGTHAVYDTLPLVDGYRWSGNGTRCGLHPVSADQGRPLSARLCGTERLDEHTLKLLMEIDDQPASCTFYEDHLALRLPPSIDLCLAYHATEDTVIEALDGNRVCYRHNGFSYGLRCNGRILPKENGCRLCGENGLLEIYFFAER